MPVPIQSNHMQIYKHEYTRIKIKSHNMLCNYHFNIKISSLGLIFKHKQFDSNYLTKHIFSQKYILEYCFGNSETFDYYSRKITINGSLSEPEIHGYSRPKFNQSMI